MGIRAEKTLQTKSDLAEAFWNLYQEKEINKITVNDIVQRAGYYRSTFYYHFEDVYAVLDYIIDSIFIEWEQIITTHLSSHIDDLMEGNVQNVITEDVPFFIKNGAYIATLLGPESDPKIFCNIKERMREKLFTMLDVPAHDVDAALIFEGVSSCVFAMFAKSYHENIPIEKVIHTFFQALNPQIFHVFLSHSENSKNGETNEKNFAPVGV